jgi:catechol 2,3-dioxygenase-like lactoylglutathione lyase family enzyme
MRGLDAKGGAMKIHHTAVCTRDMDTSLRFWQDGLGFVQKMDTSFDGDWPTLFGARQQRLRSIFLGDPDLGESGIVELVEFSGGMADAPTPPSEPAIGFFLVSVYLQIEPALARLASLSLGGTPARISLEGGVQMAVVHDPNGVTVELIDRGGG